MTSDVLTHIPDADRHEVTVDAALILDHALDLQETPQDQDRPVEFDDDGWDRS